MTTVAHRPVELAGILADPVEQFAKDKRLLTDALDRLPGTADSIASYFTERGIKGLPRTPSFCPVAEYVKQEVTDVEWVALSQAGASVRVADHLQVGVPVAPNVAQFVTEFDRGRYPNLSREARA